MYSEIDYSSCFSTMSLSFAEGFCPVELTDEINLQVIIAGMHRRDFLYLPDTPLLFFEVIARYWVHPTPDSRVLSRWPCPMS